MRHRIAPALACLAAALAAGCGQELETDYGRVRGESINGTGVLAELFERAGHEVRVARRLTDDVAEKADVIVRFAPRPGTIDAEEGYWYLDWQFMGPDRRLIYVARDYDAEAEYWDALLADPDLKANSELSSRLERLHREALLWPSRLPGPSDDPADPDDWFKVDPDSGKADRASSLAGPWAEGLDATAAALPYRQTLISQSENVLLRADDHPVAMEWSWGGEEEEEESEPGRVLVLANPGFLLNATLVNLGRRPLADRVVEWAGPAPRTIVFVEGDTLFADSEGQPSHLELIKRLPTLAWVLAHLALLGLVGALASAMILGRPRPAPDAGADRPRAHAEALGSLLGRTRDEAVALGLLETYRRWRRPGAGGNRSSAPPGAVPSGPTADYN
jgi:hypothetical protein